MADNEETIPPEVNTTESEPQQQSESAANGAGKFQDVT